MTTILLLMIAAYGVPAMIGRAIDLFMHRKDV